jgi:hypothetical protein
MDLLSQLFRSVVSQTSGSAAKLLKLATRGLPLRRERVLRRKVRCTSNTTSKARPDKIVGITRKSKDGWNERVDNMAGGGEGED